MSERVLLFIPAYNCEAQLPRVIRRLSGPISQYLDEVLVVENRSSDNTLAVAQKALSELKGVQRTLIQNDENYSLGGSIKRAILYGIEHGYTYMIVLHGDDQADPNDLIKPFSDGTVSQNDLVIGARFHKESKLEGYSRFRIIGNRLLGAFFSLVVWRRIDDLVAGLNVFRLEFFTNRLFLNFPNNLTFDAHVLLDACSRKARVAFVPVTWREEDQISNAKTIQQGWTILKLLLSFMVNRRRVLYEDKSARPLGFTYMGDIIYQGAG